MKELLIKEIEKAIEKKYGALDDSGCYVNGEWMSLQKLYWLVCDVIDDNEDLFEKKPTL